MTARDRDTKSLQDKLKVFFKKGGGGARGELVVSPELARELSPESPAPRRLRALRDLTQAVQQQRLQDGGCERLWGLVRDLAEDANSESRHAALSFLRALAEGQALELGVMRTVLFTMLCRDAPPEDRAPRRRLLQALTDHGRNISCFEERAGEFLARLLQDAPPAELVETLTLVTNVVKYNASSLDDRVVSALVTRACRVCACGAGGAVPGALQLLEAVLAYSWLPRAALPDVVRTLCRAVNVDQHAPACWKLMRHVLGGDLGPAALQECVVLLRDEREAGALRGAAFCVHMALWGPRRVPQLASAQLPVLSALETAVRRAQPAVAYEVVLALAALMARPHDLHAPGWHALLLVLRALVRLDQSLEPGNAALHARLHALLTSCEAAAGAAAAAGALPALLDVLDECAGERPDTSAVWLVTQRALALPACPAAALAFAERYVRAETRVAVRLRALQLVLEHAARHRHAHAEELVAGAVTAALQACAAAPEPALRAAAARALPAAARGGAPDAVSDLVDLLERIMNRPLETHAGAAPELSLPADADLVDVGCAARALVQLVHERLLRAPAALPARAISALLEHLQRHYARPQLLHRHPEARVAALELVLSLRVNAFGGVGCCYEGGVAVWGAGAARLRPACSPHLTAGALGAGTARALAAALAREADWSVLSRVLRALPHVLGVRALAVGRRAQDLDMLAGTLCAMLSERPLACPERRPSLSEFHSLSLPPLAALAPYHAKLEPHTQQRIVRSLLKYGMVLRAPQPYIAALTLFTLETRDTMVKMLPEVLLDLSKISDTQAIAAPMLEFLSTLTRLPRVFASFVEDQYMSVFAILLPYTNPSRYNHYVVSLAHHVIAAWFLKCRLSYRRNFVRFIIHGLHNYIIVPFEEQLQARPGAASNEDSSNRQRSSSLGSRAVSRAPLPGRGVAAGTSAAFHVELTETCVDLLARYTFTPCSVRPQRSDTAEFLLSGGQSMTWLVGHRLITITTSGCLQHSARAGLCERCAALCRQHAGAAPDPGPPPDADDAGGACPCWCAQWAEVRVRAPTGDVSWTQRVQNTVHDPALDEPLAELSALLARSPPAAAAPRAPPPAEPTRPLPSVPPLPPARSTTAPINIPGSPQRQPSSGTDDDDILLAAPEGKSRHPVRRSNSSPEMSSWKAAVREAAEPAPPAPAAPAAPPDPEPTSASMSLHQSKKAAKKSDMRVSCEAIPEEMSGTSPLAPATAAPTPAPAPPPHPHLMTYNSDPGAPAEEGAPGAHLQLQKTSSDSTVSGGRDDLPPLARSKRSNTISVMSPTRRPARESSAGSGPGSGASGGAASGGGVTPAFVFLQLYHNMSTYPITPPVPGCAPASAAWERPLRVAGVQHERSVKNLDLLPPVETYKVGVLYAAPRQHDDEVAILRNEHGSVRYAEFLRGLGSLVWLAGAEPQPDLFLTLEKGGKDGPYTYVWTDDVMQVLFHVATAMPTRDADPCCNEKRKYIGNDFVSIVYNDSGAEFNIHTIKGQFNFCIVVVEPFEHGMNRVFIKTKDERIRTEFLQHHDTYCVSDHNVALLARQMALHCALAAQISQSLKLGGAPYASNSLERLRLIKRLRARCEADRADAAARDAQPYAASHTRAHRQTIDDFNDYT